MTRFTVKLWQKDDESKRGLAKVRAEMTVEADDITGASEKATEAISKMKPATRKNLAKLEIKVEKPKGSDDTDVFKGM